MVDFGQWDNKALKAYASLGVWTRIAIAYGAGFLTSAFLGVVF